MSDNATKTYQLKPEEIDGLVCGPCTLPANAINGLSADALCKECQAKLRKVADFAAEKAARMAREDALKEVGEWLDADCDEDHNWSFMAEKCVKHYQPTKRARCPLCLANLVLTAKSGQLPASLRSDKGGK